MALTVVLTAAVDVPVTVDFATVDGVAKGPGDYLAVTGTLNFADLALWGPRAAGFHATSLVLHLAAVFLLLRLADTRSASVSARHRTTASRRSGTGAGDERVAHVRPRPLFRRGMPYGPWFDEKTQDEERGLLGLFLCTDLADQFEHLLGEWADRLPLGFPGDRHGKDPLIGAHDHPQASLLLSRRMPVNADTGKEPPDPSPLALYGFRPFVRTRGTVYAFYPPLKALERLAKAQPDWDKEEDPWLV